FVRQWWPASFSCFIRSTSNERDRVWADFFLCGFVCLPPRLQPAFNAYGDYSPTTPSPLPHNSSDCVCVWAHTDLLFWRNSGIQRIHYSITPGLHHSGTPSLRDSTTPPLHHSLNPCLHWSLFALTSSEACGAGSLSNCARNDEMKDQ